MDNKYDGIRMPRDPFEAALFRTAIRSAIASWGKKNYRNAVGAELILDSRSYAAYGHCTGVKLDSEDPDENGWFLGYATFEVNDPSIDPSDLNGGVSDVLDFVPVKFALWERESPASEPYRYEVVWEVNSEWVSLGAESNSCDYPPTWRVPPSAKELLEIKTYDA